MLKSQQVRFRIPIFGHRTSDRGIRVSGSDDETALGEELMSVLEAVFDIFAAEPESANQEVTTEGSRPVPSDDALSEYYDALDRIAHAQQDAQARSASIYIS